MERLDPSSPEVSEAHEGLPVVRDQRPVPLADERPLSPATREEEVDHEGRHLGAVGVGRTATRGDRSADPELQREVGAHEPSVKCIDCADNQVSGPDSEGFMDCPNCGAAWIPGKGEEWHISTGASMGSAWDRLSSAACRYGYEEHDGARYCFEHGGFLEPGPFYSGARRCDRAESDGVR